MCRSVSFVFSIQSVKGRRGPSRALIFDCRLKWGGAKSYILGMDGSLKLGDRTLTDHAVVEITSLDNTYIVEPGHDCSAKMTACLTPEAISFVERNRQGDVVLEVELRYQCFIINGAVHRYKVQYSHTSAHSDWVKRLKELEWNETEIFELPVLALSEDDNLKEAVKLIREAQSALLSHDHKGVLVKCRAALESAAKYESKGDTKRGFEALFARAFPGDQEKQRVMNELTNSLSGYAHALGRHEQYPAVHVSRAEAEFALVTTLGWISLIGRRLTGKETF